MASDTAASALYAPFSALLRQSAWIQRYLEGMTNWWKHALVATTFAPWQGAVAQGQQVSAYTVPAGFPTSLFQAYYIPPSPTEQAWL